MVKYILLLTLVVTQNAVAGSGRKDSNGCHNSQEEGYHCHDENGNNININTGSGGGINKLSCADAPTGCTPTINSMSENPQSIEKYYKDGKTAGKKECTAIYLELFNTLEIKCLKINDGASTYTAILENTTPNADTVLFRLKKLNMD